MNLLEYAATPAFLQSVFEWTAPGGTLIALVPQGPALFGSLDRTLGHKRRYSSTQLRELLAQYGFEVQGTRQLNKIGAPAWWLFEVLNWRVPNWYYQGRELVNNWQYLKVFDKTVWFWRGVDFLLPWRGLSLVVIARKRDARR